jgi:hypothetical protein
MDQALPYVGTQGDGCGQNGFQRDGARPKEARNGCWYPIRESVVLLTAHLALDD